MPPQTTPNITPENPALSQNPSEVVAPVPEAQPEVAPQPVSPEAPTAEVFTDQAQTQTPPTPAPAVPAVPVVETPEEVVIEEQKEVEKPGEINDAWVHAAEAVIEKDKNKPYEEEEDAEKLNVDYQQKAFGKAIKEAKDE
jgi:hypothetical protein